MESLINRMKKRFYYGWAIVGLAMVSMAFWYGFRTTFSIFFVALIDHFKWIGVCSSRLVRQAKDISKSPLHAQPLISFCHFNPLYATIRLKQ